MILEDVHPETFELFVHWLYYQRFPDADKGDDAELVALYTGEKHKTASECGNHDSNDEVRWSKMVARHLVRLYVFGDAHQIVQLRNAAVVALFKQLQDDNLYRPTTGSHRYAFDHLASESPLCRLLVDHSCLKGPPDEFDDCREENFPTPFLFAVARKYAHLVHDKPQVNLRTTRLWLADYLEDE